MFSIRLLSALLLFIHLNSFAQDRPKNFSQDIAGTKVNFEMVGIPAGTFWMGNDKGSADQQPKHQVQLDAFWMSAHEITWNVYELFVYKDYELSSNTGALPPGVDAITRPTKPYLDMTFGMGKEGYPALAMTHYNAIQFCKWLYTRTGVFYRLPTEAEWEYASKAGKDSPFFFSSTEKLGDYAWYKDNSEGKSQKVGSKKPNDWGLYDMYGNVAEWTYDQYLSDSYQARKNQKVVSNPLAVPTKLYPHVVRGGAYDDKAENISSTHRMQSHPSWKQIDPQIPKSNWWFPDAPFVGIRLVRPAKDPSKAEIDAYYNKAPISDY